MTICLGPKRRGIKGFSGNATRKHLFSRARWISYCHCMALDKALGSGYGVNAGSFQFW